MQEMQLGLAKLVIRLSGAVSGKVEVANLGGPVCLMVTPRHCACALFPALIVLAAVYTALHQALKVSALKYETDLVVSKCPNLFSNETANGTMRLLDLLNKTVLPSDSIGNTNHFDQY